MYTKESGEKGLGFVHHVLLMLVRLLCFAQLNCFMEASAVCMYFLLGLLTTQKYLHN